MARELTAVPIILRIGREQENDEDQWSASTPLMTAVVKSSLTRRGRP